MTSVRRRKNHPVCIYIFVVGKTRVDNDIMKCDRNFFSDRKKKKLRGIITYTVLHVHDVVSIRKTDETINHRSLAKITGGRAQLRGRRLRTYDRFEKLTRI